MKPVSEWLQIFLLSLLLIASSATFAKEIRPHCQIETKSEKMSDGTIVYDKAGKGPNILLLHGLFAAKEQWQPLLCLLAAAGYTAIALDLPGYGKSDDFPLAVYPLYNQVALLRQFTDRINVTQLDIAGSSMGGTIATLYANRFPENVRTLAFIGSPLGVVGWSNEVSNLLYRGINPFIPINDDQFDLELHLLFVNPPIIPSSQKREIISNYIALNRHYVDVWHIVTSYANVLWNESSSAPTLIIWGKDDQIFDISGATKLHRQIPGSEVLRLPHAGHLLLMENADEVTPIYLDFLQSHKMAATKQKNGS
jgi:pimeloyl-ACP methyl ester carboxylesterase